MGTWSCAGAGLFLIGEGLAVGPGENFLSHIRASLLSFGTFRLDQVIYQLYQSSQLVICQCAYAV